MAWFESGRTKPLEHQFTLAGRHVSGPESWCEGAAFAPGPSFTLRLAAVKQRVF